MNLDRSELELRQATFAWLCAQYEQQTELVAAARAQSARRAEQAPLALDLVERLRLSGDAVSFKESLDRLTSPKSSALALAGPNGQMVVNQIVNYSTDLGRVSDLLSRCLRTPADDQEAAERITELADYCTEIRKGTAPQSGRVAPLLSAFWMLADRERWPAKWSSAATAFERLGWNLPSDPADNYLEFQAVVRTLGHPDDVLAALLWYSTTPWLGADPVIERRIVHAWEFKNAGLDESPVASLNVNALLGPLRQAGDDLAPAVGKALDRKVVKRLSPKYPKSSGSKVVRTDAFVAWSPDTKDSGWQTAPSVRIWFGREGVLIGLHPGYREKGWIAIAKQKLSGRLPADLSIVDYWRIDAPSSQRPGQTDFFVGKFFTYDQFPWDSAADEITHVAGASLPVLQTLLADGPGWTGGPASTTAAAVEDVADDLAQLFAEFVQSTGYPRPEDLEQQSAREILAASLAKSTIASLDVLEFRRILNTNKYGFAGNRAVLNTTLSDPDEDAVQQLVADVVGDLLYGPDGYGDRLERATTRLKGLGQAGGMKLLAVANPKQFLPIYPLTGTHGKLNLLPTLGISEPLEGNQSALSIRANDLIRGRLSTVPELADDPWGQSRFAYWLRDRANEPLDDTTTLEARLATATDNCTLPPDSTFLSDLVDLLDDKGQIVLYGPPGTGKTYLALELAAALAPDEERRALVQFHPSTAYEDFMEGFRPVLRDAGLTYDLTEGPLIELANKAALDLRRPHVLIIDEMNRANLPKVFGELLFLLEYRDHPVKLAYRGTGDTFSLPPNLKIIGTMNLADRSVGQIDAALRRRFAFVSFAPNDEQNGGLLRRWLTKLNQPTWPADIVDEVNGELEAELGHADLLIGPSYFMKDGLDEKRMAVIWRYAIEPLMGDLFHGDEQLVKQFGWEAVTKRFASLIPGNEPAAAPDPEPEADLTGAADGDAPDADD